MGNAAMNASRSDRRTNVRFPIFTAGILPSLISWYKPVRPIPAICAASTTEYAIRSTSSGMGLLWSLSVPVSSLIVRSRRTVSL